MMSILVAIEGIDGAGKGTQTELLLERLQDAGFSATSLQFPRYSATAFGEAIGDFLNGRFGSLDHVHPQLAAVLYAGDRFESKELLLQKIANHDVVVLDRFIGSSLAHQCARLEGAERNGLQQWIERIEHGVFGLPRPDLNLLIDVSSKVSRELVARKGARDYTDQEADLQESNLPYLEKVRSCYLEIASQRDDWMLIPGLDEDARLRSIHEIGDEIFEHVRTFSES